MEHIAGSLIGVTVEGETVYHTVPPRWRVLDVLYRVKLQNQRGREEPRLFVGPVVYRQALTELTGVQHIAQLNAPIASQQASKEGYENFMYAGAVICLER